MSEASATTEGGFSLRRYVQKVVDFAEPVIVGLIHLCGWSAIIFVMAIFFFVFKESLPAITGLEEEVVHTEVENLIWLNLQPVPNGSPSRQRSQHSEFWR